MQSALLLNDSMATSKEIRIENLRALVKEFTTADAVAQAAGTAPMYLSQILNSAKSSTGTPRGIGDKLARKLEVGCGKPEGWMDTDHSSRYKSNDKSSTFFVQEEAASYLVNASRVNTGEPTVATVAIKKVTMHLQAGVLGIEMEPDFEDGGTLDVPLQWVEENEYVPHCLVAIRVRGESMRPTLFEDDVAIVNIADTKKIHGRVFAINFNGESVVKRLKHEGREWYLTSDNPDPEYRPRLCRTGECIIVGRIVRFEPRNFADRL